MTSKCGKDKRRGAHKAIAKCFTDVPDATGNKRETNFMSLASLHSLKKKDFHKSQKRAYETKIKKFNKFLYKHNTDL
mgnify:CR=1 FL=1